MMVDDTQRDDQVAEGTGAQIFKNTPNLNGGKFLEKQIQTALVSPALEVR